MVLFRIKFFQRNLWKHPIPFDIFDILAVDASQATLKPHSISDDLSLTSQVFAQQNIPDLGRPPDGMALCDVAGTQALLMQLVYPTPRRLNEGDGVVRWGWIDAQATAIDWQGWTPLPPRPEHTIWKDPWVERDSASGQFVVGLIAQPESSAGATGAEIPQLFWTPITAARPQ
ncbi:MAG: hypothetical protein ABI743_11180 [bacterium]